MEKDHRTLKHFLLVFGYFFGTFGGFYHFCCHKTNASDSGSKTGDSWTVKNLSVLRHQKSQETSKTGGSQKQRRPWHCPPTLPIIQYFRTHDPLHYPLHLSWSLGNSCDVSKSQKKSRNWLKKSSIHGKQWKKTRQKMNLNDRTV